MEDFYPFRSEDIPELVKLVQQSFVDKDKWGKKRKENAISFLLPLVIELLDDIERIKSLNKTVLEEFGKNRNAKVSDGFWKIVRAYLEVNNGTGNLSRITEVLKSNAHWWIAGGLQKFFLRYSLPALSEGSGNVSVYSLSRDFLHAEKKDIAGDSVSILNANSVEKALQNSVLLEEIFKKLQFVDQKLFRLVSPTWLEESFSFWRRNARILIHVSANGKENEHHSGISLSFFMDLWEKNKEMSDRIAKGNVQAGMVPVEDAGNYKLQDHPFRSYQVSYKNCRKSKGEIFSCGKSENKFWKSCGLFMEDLEIKNDSISTKICERLLQEFCQNLKRLKISCYNWVKIPEDTSSSEEDENYQANSKSDKMEAKLNNPQMMKIAENLHTLILDGGIDEDSLRCLLFICSNLKTLVLESFKQTVGALLSPTSTGEFIKLKKLVLISYIREDLFSLRQYTDLLAKKKFDSLEHLSLVTELFHARFPPFNLYAALAQTRNNLKTLDLELVVQQFDGAGAHEKFDWFIDLSPFPFPNLTELNFRLEWSAYTGEGYDHANFYMKFDFGTLKGMPMLKKLEINIKNVEEEVLRSPGGAQDWVFEGDRNRYLPTGVTVDYQLSANDPILCSNLKEFTFDGWSINEEDVRLLSSWFPNLTRLEAEVNLKALPILLENWPQLEKLIIHTENCISLGKLRPLKEKKTHLRIFQRFLKDKVITDESVELKERNGWLFFTNC